MYKEEDLVIVDYDFKEGLLKILNKIYLVIMILIILLNIMICIVLVYYGNMLAFMFIINIFYIIKYHRLINKEKVRNALG